MIIGENGRFTSYEPLGWKDNDTAIYKVHKIFNEPIIYSYNLHTQEIKPFKTSNGLYIENCNREDQPHLGLIPEHCIPDRNVSGFGRFNEVLISPDKSWALLSVSYSEIPYDLIIIKR